MDVWQGVILVAYLNIYLSEFLFASSLLTVSIAVYSMNQRDVGAAKFFALLCLSSTIYSFGYGMELLSSHLAQMMRWDFFQYAGVEAIPIFWFLLAVEICGMEKILTPFVKFILFFTPAFLLAVIYTDPIFHLYYKGMYVVSNGYFPVLIIQKGPLYILNTVYIVSFVIVTSILYLKLLLQSKGKFQSQSAIMFFSSLLPLIAHFMLVFNFNPLGIDYAPFFLILSYLMILFGLFKYKLFNLIPLAHHKVFESMKDPVIVLDKEYKIIDFNVAAFDVFNELQKQTIGQNLKQVLSSYNDILKCADDGKDRQFEKIVSQQSTFYSVKRSVLNGKFQNVIGYILILNNITKQIVNMKKLQKIASIDNLTEIFNRRYFIEECELNMENAKEVKEPISLIMLDLDHFKNINDRYGHQAGDVLLRNVANVCKSSVRSSDILGRFGGEEFMVFLPATKLDEAVEIGERVRKNIEKLNVIFNSHHLKITASVGVSFMDGSSEDKLDLLIKGADDALYKAKKNGRNCLKTERVYVEG